VAAGALDVPTKLSTIGHLWIEQIADYSLLQDGLLQFARKWQK